MTLLSDKKSLPERIDKALDWLETSRDSWKNKAKIAKEELKKRTLAVKRARESKGEYKEQLEQAEEAVRTYQVTGKPRFHTYWNSLIALALSLTSIACASFTGAANTMEIFRSQGKIDRAPSPETCIQWEMKMGLYKLSRPKATSVVAASI